MLDPLRVYSSPTIHPPGAAQSLPKALGISKKEGPWQDASHRAGWW